MLIGGRRTSGRTPVAGLAAPAGDSGAFFCRRYKASCTGNTRRVGGCRDPVSTTQGAAATRNGELALVRLINAVESDRTPTSSAASAKRRSNWDFPTAFAAAAGPGLPPAFR